MDHLVAVVLRDDQGDRQAFLRGGDQLGRCHQEGAVTEERGDPGVRVGVRQPHADRGRDLVAHAGEAELEVAGAAAGGVPHLLQVAGRAAGGGDDHVAGLGVLLQHPDDLPLGEHRVGVGHDVGVGRHRRLVEQLVRVERVGPLDAPRRGELLGPGPPRGRTVRTSALASASAARARFASPTMPTAPSRSASWTLTLMLAKRTSGLAKIEWDAGGEVGQPGPDGEHQVGLPGQRVGRRGAFQADAAELPPRGLLDRALAGEGLRDRGTRPRRRAAPARRWPAE